MARMIPVIIGPTDSPGETEIFQRLRDDPQTVNWIVLHSLDVANHESQLSGEADFVIVVPEKGVLILEVKACRNLERRTDGAWYYGSNPKPDFRGPFKQATEVLHSTRAALIERRPDLSRVPFWSAVCFPYFAFNTHSAEWHEWQVIDGPAFRGRPISANVTHVLMRARENLASSPSAVWFRDSEMLPTPNQCRDVAEVLRPTFEFFESPRARIGALDRDVKRYTADQFSAIDALEQNDRIVLNAPAGTGKTMLAIEAARRSSNAGARVLLICFNRFLGQWLKQQFASDGRELTVGTLHAELLRIAGSPAPKDAPKEFWVDELPALAIERLLARNDASLYDEIVIDEAQDILRPNYLDVLDLALCKGLAGGRWRMFGDFEKQAIFGAASLSLDSFLSSRVPSATRCRLRTNCRNTPRIAEHVHLLGGLEPNYDRVLRPDDEIDPVLRYFTTREEEEDAILSDEIERLLDAGFACSGIVILAPSWDCAAQRLATSGRWRGRLRSFDDRRPDSIAYCSVQAFKGLDSQAVVLTGVHNVVGDEAQSLIYVAASRALHRLSILADRAVRQSLHAAIIGALETSTPDK